MRFQVILLFFIALTNYGMQDDDYLHAYNAIKENDFAPEKWWGEQTQDDQEKIKEHLFPYLVYTFMGMGEEEENRAVDLMKFLIKKGANVSGTYQQHTIYAPFLMYAHLFCKILVNEKAKLDPVVINKQFEDGCTLFDYLWMYEGKYRKT